MDLVEGPRLCGPGDTQRRVPSLMFQLLRCLVFFPALG